MVVALGREAVVINGRTGRDVLALSVLVGELHGLGDLGLLERAATGAEAVEAVVGSVDAFGKVGFLGLEEAVSGGLAQIRLGLHFLTIVLLDDVVVFDGSEVEDGLLVDGLLGGSADLVDGLGQVLDLAGRNLDVAVGSILGQAPSLGEAQVVLRIHLINL